MSLARLSSRAARSCALSALLGLATAANAQPPSEAPAAPAGRAGQDRELARSAFERGIALARDGRYAEAKAAFLTAYAAHPHYLVLYNIAQADRRLGNFESAIGYLERFLREGATVVSPERRAEVESQIAELRAQSSRGAASPDGESGDATSAQDLSAQDPSALDPSRSDLSPGRASVHETPPAAALGPGAQALPAGAQREAGALPAASAGKPWGIVLGASGVALLGVATGLFFWNDTRHGDWQKERRALDALPNREQALRTDLAIWQRARSNNELLGAIQRVDVLALVMAGVGATALGAGAWSVLGEPAAGETALVASGTTLTWRTAW